MENYSTLSNNAILIIVVILAIIIIIIILIAVFSDNNNNNNGGSTILESKINKNANEILESNINKNENEILEINNKSDVIISYQKKNIELISGILDISGSSNINHINASDFLDEKLNNKISFEHETEILDSLEIKDLNIEFQEKVETEIQSLNYQHQSFSDTTEFFDGNIYSEPSEIKKNIFFYNDKNEKIPVKDKSPISKISLTKKNMILNSDLSSPDDVTIAKIKKKIPLPKGFNK